VNFRINRRRLLNRGAAVALLLTPFRRVFAAANLSSSLDEFLLVLLQRLFPHPDVPTNIYEDVAERLAESVRNDPALTTLVETGRQQLDQGGSAPWIDLDEARQTARLREIENSTFFQTLRAMSNFSFYGNPDVWTYFGYEGSSFEKGGYLRRGFDDLNWLPDPKP